MSDYKQMPDKDSLKICPVDDAWGSSDIINVQTYSNQPKLDTCLLQNFLIPCVGGDDHTQFGWVV